MRKRLPTGGGSGHGRRAARNRSERACPGRPRYPTGRRGPSRRRHGTVPIRAPRWSNSAAPPA